MHLNVRIWTADTHLTGCVFSPTLLCTVREERRAEGTMCAAPEGRGTEGQGSDVSIDWVLARSAPGDGRRRANTVIRHVPREGPLHSYGHKQHADKNSTKN